MRIRARADDPLALRMRGDAALRALDLEPPGLPQRATLCIRSLADPMPGGLDLRSAHAPRATAWEAAARNAISYALRAAVRPAWLGFIPLDAPAVLFDDNAELLACAARDATLGVDGWWWARLLRGALTIENVVRLWLREPVYVPAAVHLLVESGSAIPFIRRIAPPDAIALATHVLRVHQQETVAAEVVKVLTTEVEPLAPSRPRWLPLAEPVISESFLPEQQLFAIVTMLLRRAPAVLATPSFVRELVSITVAIPHRPPVRHEPEWRTGDPACPSPSLATETAGQARSPVLHFEHRETRQRRETPAPVAAPEKKQPVPHETETPHVVAAPPRPTTAPVTTPPVEESLAKEEPEAQELTPLTTPTPDLPSDHAGVFFLLNAAIALGLHDPWTGEWRLNVTPWDFLAQAARALAPSIKDDPVLELLETLGTSNERLPRKIIRDVWHFVRAAIDEKHPTRFLIRRYGRITVTPAHLDVSFALAVHPVGIRIAGLDRDPGWIPAAGRHVAFHFD